jgi:8-oxo-dGTP diphosphatase
MIIRVAQKRLKGKIRYQPVGFELLDEQFTMPELQRLYESILETKFDRRNFYKKITKTGLLLALDKKAENVGHKPARYFQFDKKKYHELIASGFNFEI